MASGWAQVVADVISVSLAASVYGFSRDLEQEADLHAVTILADSPYDVDALPELLDILRQDYEGLNPRVSTMWSTHPELELRIALALAYIAALPDKERDVDAYQIAAVPVRVMTIQDYIQDDYPQTALALAESLAARNPNDARTLQLLGDAWQGMGAQTRIDPEEWAERDKRRNLRARNRKTREERLEELLETNEGRAAYAENLALAEENYQRALELAPGFPDPHRGLGEVYEQLGRSRDAAASYLAYVRAAEDAPDRVVIVGRLRALNDLLRAEE
jgi:predicted Zn-dependent protease